MYRTIRFISPEGEMLSMEILGSESLEIQWRANVFEDEMQKYRIYSNEEVRAIEYFFAIIAIVKEFQIGTIKPTNYLYQSTFDIIKPILLMLT